MYGLLHSFIYWSSIESNIGWRFRIKVYLVRTLTSSKLGGVSPDWKHADGTALGFNISLAFPFMRARCARFLKLSFVKCLLQIAMSVHVDSLKRCLLTVARNWTHSSLLSGSFGNLNLGATLGSESHPTTEHILDLDCVPPALKLPVFAVHKEKQTYGFNYFLTSTTTLS